MSKGKSYNITQRALDQDPRKVCQALPPRLWQLLWVQHSATEPDKLLWHAGPAAGGGCVCQGVHQPQACCREACESLSAPPCLQLMLHEIGQTVSRLAACDAWSSRAVCVSLPRALIDPMTAQGLLYVAGARQYGGQDDHRD